LDRFYRNPLVTFGIGPIFLFLVKHRFPWDIPRSWTVALRNVWLTNLALVGVLVAMALTIGLAPFFLVQIPVTLFASAAGVWLFFVQHQFENTYWDWHDDWDFYDAALEGSSHLALPKPLQWLTASIGLHHVHHLSSRIPNYRLQKAMDENPELQQATRLTIPQTIGLIRLALWDEERRRLVRFRDIRGMGRGAAA